jgi:hypothetical protein
MELGRPDWPIGSLIFRGDEPNLRVVDLLEDERENPAWLLALVGGRRRES